jgi:hypothetical protein
MSTIFVQLKRKALEFSGLALVRAVHFFPCLCFVRVSPSELFSFADFKSGRF